jgi:tRNA nucleotidyltransferase (CCA-adding enzyme)
MLMDGLSMETYLVGGAVRDKLLDYPVYERDWVVVGVTAEQMLEAGYSPVGKDFPVFLHPVTREEYALARTERKTGKGYTGFHCFSSPDVTLEEDLKRRDLTINAIAEDSDGNLIDPYGGQQDLNNRILRHVSPAFEEDPLRVLRVARFYARYHHFGFSIADETLELMRAMANRGELAELVAERVWMEMHRALKERQPQMFFNTLHQVGGLEHLVPELVEISRFDLAMKGLEYLLTRTEEATSRFAVIFAHLPEDKLLKWCDTYRTPNDFRDLALIEVRHGRDVAAISGRDPENDAGKVLALLESVDAFRRPDRFARFLQVSEATCYAESAVGSATIRQSESAEFESAVILRGSLEVASRITVQNVDPELKGKAIGDAIAAQRLVAIGQMLRSATT